MIGKLYEMDHKIDLILEDMRKLTVYTNALAQIIIDAGIATPTEVIEMIGEKEDLTK